MLPRDMNQACSRMAGIYQRGIAQLLHKKFRQNLHMWSQPGLSIDSAAVLGTSTVVEFDRHFTAPLSNYEFAEAYHTSASSVRYVDGVRVPLLCLTARDDPVSPWRAVPRHVSNPFVIHASTQTGGHIGFWSGLLPQRCVY